MDEWYKKKRAQKIEHEIQNGLEVLDARVRISDRTREKIESGKTQVLIIDKDAVLFRKKVDNGYWVNTTYEKGRVLYLHREKLRRHLNLSEEAMRGYEVHHIDGNIDNNDITNLKLMTRNVHQILHATRSEQAKRHVCRDCGRTYYASVSDSIYRCDKCGSPSGAPKQFREERVCEMCGNKYTAKAIHSKFCSNKCKSAWRRASGRDDETRVCELCGGEYKANRYYETKTCYDCRKK